MNLFITQKHTHIHRNKLTVIKGDSGGDGGRELS